MTATVWLVQVAIVPGSQAWPIVVGRGQSGLLHSPQTLHTNALQWRITPCTLYTIDNTQEIHNTQTIHNTETIQTHQQTALQVTKNATSKQQQNNNNANLPADPICFPSMHCDAKQSRIDHMSTECCLQFLILILEQGPLGAPTSDNLQQTNSQNLLKSKPMLLLPFWSQGKYTALDIAVVNPEHTR